jgi:hypothetical protein
MDTSETYINQCQKATEIQAAWQFDDGDFYQDPDVQQKADEWVAEHQTRPINTVVALCEMCNVKDSYGDVHVGEYTRSEYIWLPRQDQLQAMVPNVPWTDRPIWRLVESFASFVMDLPVKGWSGQASMEQLWLALVMHQKYGKRWTGGEWA